MERYWCKFYGKFLDGDWWKVTNYCRKTQCPDLYLIVEKNVWKLGEIAKITFKKNKEEKDECKKTKNIC